MGGVEADCAQHRGREQGDHVVDVHHRRLGDRKAPAFEIHDSLSGDQHVVEPVDPGSVGQRDDDILVG